jgi:Flp pilus assembly protein TadD
MSQPNWSEDEVFLVAQRGHALFLQGRYEEATIIFEGLRAVNPTNVYCANALSALYIRNGQASRAVDLLGRILETHPDDVQSRARRCEALLMLGRLGDARKDWAILRRFSTAEVARLRILIELAESKSGLPKQLSPAKFDN